MSGVSKINGIALANIAKVDGVAIANVGKVSGITVPSAAYTSANSVFFDGTNDYIDTNSTSHPTKFVSDFIKSKNSIFVFAMISFIFLLPVIASYIV